MKKIFLTIALIISIIASCSKSDIPEYDPKPISLVPSITSFAPKTGKTGEVITIEGTNFTTLSANIITINGKAAAVKSTLQTKIEVLVPADCGNGSVVLENINGKATSNDLFTYIIPLPTAPTITNFTPIVAKAGQTITITGTNFSTSTPNIVTLNGNNAIVQSATSTSIVITIPTGTGTGSLVVTNINGAATAGSTFTYALSPPVITTFSPTTAKIGDTVTITGENFTTATPNVVTINGNSAVVQSATATTITVLVPSGTVSGIVSVTNINGTANSSVNFNYTLLPPTITGFSPAKGRAGDLITINGTNFTTTTPNTVTINGVTAVVQSFTSSSIVVAVPNNAGSGVISVSNSNGTATSGSSFTYLLPPPTITSFTPMRGKAGDIMFIDGTNFTSSTTVTINAVNALVEAFSITSTRLKVTVPTLSSSNLIAGKVSVQNENGSATSVDNFTFVDDSNSANILPKSIYFVRYSNENVTGDITYNGNKLSLIKFTESLTSRKNSKAQYTYSGDLITYIYYTTDDSFDYISESFEYSGSLLSKSILTVVVGSVTSTTTKTYTHNGNEITYTRTVKNGDKVEIKDNIKLVISNGNIIEDDGITFRFDNANNPVKNITGHDKILAEGLFFRYSKNNILNDNPPIVTNSYEYNSNNYPSKTTISRSFIPDGAALTSITYTY